MNTIDPSGAMSVRVDGSYIPDPRQPQKGRSGAAARPDGAGTDVSGDGTEVVSSQKRLIANARAVPEVDTHAIAEAKALLADGALDTAEAIDRAAQALLDTGL